MTKNSRHVIEITDATAKGFGMGVIGGFNVFVDGALPGDVVDTLLVKVKTRFAFGKIINVLKPSPFRLESPCAVSDKCGGCQWQHCEYSAQLGFKKKIVQGAFEKIGGISEPPVFDVLGMENPRRYRNKAVFPVVPTANGFGIGMYAPRSHRLVEVADCGIQHEAHVKILDALAAHMRRHKITAYDETTHKGIMRHIMVRTSLATGEVMVVLVANLVRKYGKTAFPSAGEFVEKLAALGVTTVILNRHASRGNVILGEDFEVLHGAGFITEKLGEIAYQISAPSFFQINPVQAKKLYQQAVVMAGLDGSQSVVDAHVGAGGVALFAAKHARHVLGVDIVKPAIADAQKNAALNGITNAEFVCGAAEEIVPKLLAEGAKPDVVFLDPPRKGCDAVLLDALISAEVEKIVYISCDPATLARDVKILTAGGYQLTAVQPVDMFPFTGKVENVAALRRG
jgi:23S rRNA (uracil1939-C5)-methyltransferase